jgi:chromosome segregation ATPase
LAEYRENLSKLTTRQARLEERKGSAEETERRARAELERLANTDDPAEARRKAEETLNSVQKSLDRVDEKLEELGLDV